MLVISRREGESIQIGDNITLTIVRVDARGVRLGIEAPLDATIMRRELIQLDRPSSNGSSHSPDPPHRGT